MNIGFLHHGLRAKVILGYLFIFPRQFYSYKYKDKKGVGLASRDCANDAQFAIRRVDQAACWVVGEVFFMVMKAC